MSKPAISVAEAKQDKLFYVVANFAVVNPRDKTVLLLQRGEHEKVHPGKWAFAGGKLEHGGVAEMIEAETKDPLEGIENILGKLAEKETKEESGLTVRSDEDYVITNKVFIRPDGVPVFMVTMAAEYQGGEVILEEGVMASAWVTAEQLDDYDCIPGIQKEGRQALGLFAGLR